MPKALNLLKLVHLFSHRRVVTREMITAVCRIPKRTVFRYLNDLSEAGIPIYYDRNLGGYCLANAINLRVDSLTYHEAVLVAIGLRLVQRHLGTEYRHQLAEIGYKIVAKQPAMPDGLLAEQRSSEATPIVVPDYSSDVAIALIQAASYSKLSVRVTTRERETSVHNGVTIHNPKLLFRQGWQVVDETMEDLAIDVKQILHVKIR